MVAFDMWPPGVLPMYTRMAPASSLTWHLTYVHPLQHQVQDWFKYKVFTDLLETAIRRNMRIYGMQKAG